MTSTSTKPESKTETVTTVPKVTVEDVTQRWNQVFGKYASQGFDNISSAWMQSWSMLNNPFLQNARIKQINSTPMKAQQEELQKALANPQDSEQTLSKISMWLYYTNYMYNLLIKLNRDVPQYNYYYIPQYLDEKKMKVAKFREESKKVDRILKALKPKLTFKTIATQVSLEGKASYLPRISYSKKDNKVVFFLLQKLNSDMVKLTGFGSKQQFIASFNMAIFLQPAYSPIQYPPFIQEAWKSMINTGIVVFDKKNNARINPKANIPSTHRLEWNGTNYFYWIELPQDMCYTFYSDGAHPNAFPDTIGLFNDLNDLDDYKWLQANLLSKGVNSILTAEVPLIKDPKAGSDATVITPDTILGYEDFFSANISGNIFPFFGPFKEFSLHTLENQPESMDIIFDRTRDLVATSGNSALMSITDKPSIASVKAAQMLQEARCDYMTKQFEEFVNEMLKSNFDLEYEWHVTLWGGIYYNREDIKILREEVSAGMRGMIPKLLSANGLTVEDYIAGQEYVDALGVDLEKVSNIVDVNEKKSTSVTEKKVGRPKLADDDIVNDNTGTSVDAGNNISEIKEFSVSAPYTCLICGEEIEEDEVLCDDCLQEMYETRLEQIMAVTAKEGDRKDD